MCSNPEQYSHNYELVVDNAAHTEGMKYQMLDGKLDCKSRH